jgi:hypothetical protein
MGFTAVSLPVKMRKPSPLKMEWRASQGDTDSLFSDMDFSHCQEH